MCSLYLTIVSSLPQGLQDQSNADLWTIYENTSNEYLQCQLLQTFLKREGLYWKIGGHSVEERLEGLVQQAGSHQNW